jgi:serine/threonine-protein kinase
VLDRDVAVKHLRGDLKIPREVKNGLVTRMRHEARAAARVVHPNLVVLHDMGEDPGVGLFLVFEYIEGPTLKQRLQRETRVPAVEAARLARELGAALTTAHEAGILHRDVKPENIMLSKHGGKIADFGIARIPDSTLTHQGGLMGTPAYSAPETFRAGKFSPESDQFSLAASLYEAISGRRAFPGDDAVTVAARIASTDPDPFAAKLGLPAAVDTVLMRAMAKTPEARYPSCEAFGAALTESLDASTEATATATMPLVRKVEPPRESRTTTVLLGAAVVVVTAILLVRASMHAPEPTRDIVPMVSAATPPPRKPRIVTRPRPTTVRPDAGSAEQAPLPDAGAPAPVPVPAPEASSANTP